jgi:signal transduction histidine kinase
MPDLYQLPALLLTALLLPAFGLLYSRSRDARTLLWLVGLGGAVLGTLSQFRLGPWDLTHVADFPWISAAAETCLLIASVAFVTSFSPLSFRLGRFRILYAVPFSIPLVAYAILLFGVYRGTMPGAMHFLLFPVLGALSLIVGFFWGYARGNLPIWLGLGLCVVLGGAGLWICLLRGGVWPLLFVECALRFTAALLVLYAFRRLSPGTVISALGFVAWSLDFIQFSPWLALHAGVALVLARLVAMGKVLVAIGLILLALEDELSARRASQRREGRARQELDAYAKIASPRRRIENFDHQAPEICRTIVANSRFTQAALILLQDSGQFRLAGSAGMEEATVNALEALVARIPLAGFLAPGSALPALEHSQTVYLDLQPWLLPGDDLKRLRLPAILAAPLYGRSGTEGALLLAGPRNQDEPLSTDDLLPLEALAVRIQSARSQTVMLEKLIDAEKFAGLGQLAANVVRQLNNPVTVILGYASLLEESEALTPQAHRGVEAILTEARRMRSTLESLSRLSRTQNEHLTSISVTELLSDLEQLHRSEFLHRSIDFRLNMAPELPRVLGNAQQLRQAVLHCLQFAIKAVENQSAAGEKMIRLEATAEGDHVRILITHTGQAFLHPERAFDPLVPKQSSGETSSLGLSLCATILRDNGGSATAMNLESRGAALLLELQAA